MIEPKDKSKMEIALPDSHILYRTANDIQQICVPLNTFLGINTFSYVKIFNDMSRIHLTTHSRWNKFFYKKLHHYCKKTNVTECQHWHSGYSVLYRLAETECIKDAKEFNIGDGIVISNYENSATELCYFSLTKHYQNKEVTNLINNIDLLYKFILYFRHKASSIIKEAEANPIALPFLKPNTTKNNFSINPTQRELFLKTINVEDVHLTKREIECSKLLAEDMSMKEIAKFLNISHRTVEKHLNNAKRKLGFKKQSCLVKYIIKNNIYVD